MSTVVLSKQNFAPNKGELSMHLGFIVGDVAFYVVLHLGYRVSNIFLSKKVLTISFDIPVVTYTFPNLAQ